MPRTVRLLAATGAVAILLVIAAFAAAPATASYQGVERTIQAIRKSWDSPGAAAQPNRPGWDALFDGLLADLRAYGNAESETDRLAALDPIYQISEDTGFHCPGNRRRISAKRPENGCGPASEWLGPGAGSAETIEAMPATVTPASRPIATLGRLCAIDLGTALCDYDSAPTVAKRQIRPPQDSRLGGSPLRRKPQTAVVAFGRAGGRRERPVQPS